MYESEVELAVSQGRPMAVIQQLRAKQLDAMRREIQVCEEKLQVLQIRDTATFQLAMRYKAAGRRSDAISLLREVADSAQGFPLGEQALRELNAMGE